MYLDVVYIHSCRVCVVWAGFKLDAFIVYAKVLAGELRATLPFSYTWEIWNARRAREAFTCYNYPRVYWGGRYAGPPPKLEGIL